MDLIAELSDEADTQNPTRRGGDDGLSCSEKRKCGVAQIECGQRSEDPTGSGACDIDGCVLPGEVHQADVQSPPRRQASELAKDPRRVARGRGQIEPLWSQPCDDTVIEDDTGLIQHETVAGGSNLEIGKAPRVNP